MLKTTNIVIEPYRPGVLEKLKLGPKELNDLNPRILLLRVSGYGQTGAMALRRSELSGSFWDLASIKQRRIITIPDELLCRFRFSLLRNNRHIGRFAEKIV